MDKDHPLVTRAWGPGRTRLNKLATLLRDCRRPALLNSSYGPTEATEDLDKLRRGLQGGDILLFTDDSQNKSGLTDYGFIGYQGQNTILKGCGSLGNTAEVYDAEVMAIEQALGNLRTRPETGIATNFHVYTDNAVAAKVLQGQPTDSSQNTILKIRLLAKQWPCRRRLPHIQPGSVQIHWIPGHKGIRGNEEADRLAKQGAAQTPPTNLTATLAKIGRIAKAKEYELFETWWKRNAPESYQDLGITLSKGPPSELSLARRTLGHLIAARTGHGDFKAYHERFGHKDAVLNCSCGQPKSPTHLLTCRISRRRSKKLHGLLPTDILGTPKGAILYAKYVEETGHFRETCPTHHTTTLPPTQRVG